MKKKRITNKQIAAIVFSSILLIALIVNFTYGIGYDDGHADGYHEGSDSVKAEWHKERESCLENGETYYVQDYKIIKVECKEKDDTDSEFVFYGRAIGW